MFFYKLNIQKNLKDEHFNTHKTCEQKFDKNGMYQIEKKIKSNV